MTMSVAGPSVEVMFHEVLDRQRRSEARIVALEAAIEALANPTREPALPPASPPMTDTVPLAKLETPLAITWPKRTLPAPALPPLVAPAANNTRSGGVIRTPPPRRVEPPPPEATVPVVIRKFAPATYPAPAEIPGSVVAATEVLSSLDEAIWSVSLDGSLVFFLAGAVEKVFGQPSQTLRDRSGAWLESFPADDRGRLLLGLRRLPDTGVFTLEHRLETAGRAPRWVVTRGRLVRAPDGRPLRVDGVTADLTDRTRTERALAAVVQGVGAEAGHEYLTKLTEHLAIVAEARLAFVAALDPNDPLKVRTVAAWADGAAAENFDLPVLEGVGRDLAEGSPCYLPSRARERLPHDELLTRLRADTLAAEPLVDSRGQIVGILAVADDRAIRPAVPDLQQIVRLLAPRAAVELGRRGPARCDQLEGLLAESERRRHETDGRLARFEEQVRDLEEQLRQSRRLETIGRLVAGVAHDFNNLLTLICGNAELIRESLPGEDRNRDAAEQVVAAGHSAAALTRQLLALARPTAAEPRPLDLNGVVRGAEKMIRRLVGESLTLTVNLSPSVELVRADPVQVEQVLFNLVANARDAVGSGGSGSVIVRTADALIDPLRPGWPEHLPTGGYVALTVSDTGCGMSDEVKARLFEPFFTTKPPEKGTGLGLANVRDVVQRSGGHVEVESAIGWGTSIRIYWPKLATFVPDTLDDFAVVPLGPQHLGRGETVLLVEDEFPVRELARSALQQAGYRVLEAADADMAEERSRLYAGFIGLLITDIGLPRRDGIQLAAQLRGVRPDLKVLYLSGYSPPYPLRTIEEGEFLAKPYTPQRLLEVVRDIIGIERQE